MKSCSAFNSIIRNLIQKELIIVHEIRTRTKGQLSHFYEICDKGYLVLGLNKPEGLSRGGSWNHDFWIHKISESITNIYKDFRVSIEGRLNDVFIDVLVESNTHKKIAVEIEMDVATIRRNLDKDIHAECSAIIIAHEPEIAEKVKSIMNEYPEKIRDMLFPMPLYAMLNTDNIKKLFDKYA